MTQVIALNPTNIADRDGDKRVFLTARDFYRQRREIFRKLKRFDEAWSDFEREKSLGGPNAVTYTQKGLAERKLYSGPIDGKISPALKEAVINCWKGIGGAFCY